METFRGVWLDFAQLSLTQLWVGKLGWLDPGFPKYRLQEDFPPCFNFRLISFSMRLQEGEGRGGR